MLISAAQAAMHERSRLAFAAAAAAGLPGEFGTVERGGLLATRTTAPGLAFLNVVTGVDPETVDAVPDVLAGYDTAPSLLVTDPDDGVHEHLHGWGFEPVGSRPIAWLDLAPAAGPNRSDGVVEVRDASGLAFFLDVLAAGYDAPSAVTRFMRAEHGADAVRRFVSWRDGEPVAVAAMSVHSGVAVLGGAAVLPAERGRGRQLPLLQHRLDAARRAGCTAAVATAAPDSASLANLRRTGFDVHLRTAWRATPADR